MIDEKQTSPIDPGKKSAPEGEFPSAVSDHDREKKGRATKFKLVVNRQTPSAASRKAAWLGVALVWGLAILFLFIPFAQYITPILFLGGAYYAWTLLHRDSRYHPTGQGGAP